MTSYILSQDPRLEIGWIYRLESDESGDTIRCVNELAGHCGSPTIALTALPDYHLVPLTPEAYTTLIECYTRATDADLRTAQAIVQEILTKLPNTPAVCRKTWDGSDAITQAAILPPFGPGFAPAIAERTTRLEYWVTTFDQPADFVEYRAWADMTPLATRRFAGY